MTTFSRRTVATLTCTIASVLTLTAALPSQSALDPRQWPLDTAHFDAARIWPLATGGGVIVAVLDTGVSVKAPGLEGRLEQGADFTDTAADGTVDTSSDSHGTSVAALIADAQGSDVVGLAPEATILPVRVTEGTGETPTALAEGITYAIDHHARVINISMGTPVDDPQVSAAVEYAVQHNIIVVAAVGNDGTDGNAPQYPADLPGVLAVSGSRRDNSAWPLSEYGSYVSLAAPAENIYLTDANGEHGLGSGTSYAAPYVSAAAALLISRYPDETAGQIISRLITTAVRPTAVPNPSAQLGHGVVNPYGALTAPTPAEIGNPLIQDAAGAVPKSSPPHRDGSPWWPYPAAGALLLAPLCSWLIVKKLKARKN